MSLQLLFSSNLLKRSENLNKIMEILIDTPREVVISRIQSDKDGEDGLEYRKLKLICQQKNKIKTNVVLTMMIWDGKDYFSTFSLKGDVVNIVLIDDGMMENNEVSHVIMIRRIEQLREIFGLSIFQLEKRCRMQKIMRRAQQRCLENQSKQTLKTMIIAYNKKMCQINIQKILKFLRWNTKNYKNRIKKYFNIWLISIYQTNISKMNQNIINQGYISKSNARQIIKKSFLGWKDLLHKP